MRVLRFLFVLLPILLLSGAGGTQPANPPGDVAFINCRTLAEGTPAAALVNRHTLHVRDGKVVAFGPEAQVSLPSWTTKVDLKGQVVIPGLVAAETTIAERGRDDVLTFTPHYRAVDGFDFLAPQDTLLAGGVTTVQLSPGSRRLMPGQGAVVKLAGNKVEERLLKENESLRVLLGDAYKNPPRIYEPPVGATSGKPLEPTLPQMGGGLAGAMAGLRAAFAVAKAELAKPAAQRSTDPEFLALLPYISGKQPVRITAPTAADLRAALLLAKEFNLKLLLVDVPTNALTVEEWRKAKEQITGVLLNAGQRPGQISDIPVPSPDQPKPRRAGELARDLRAAGIKFALVPADDADLKDLLFLAGTLIGDLPRLEALRAVTRYPAELLGVADRVGILQTGRDADFLVLSDDPFGARPQVRAVYVRGLPVWEKATKTSALLVKAGHVHFGDGHSLSRGQVLVEGGKVRGVGTEISAPLDVAVREFPANSVIVPGFLDLGTGLGFGGPVSQPIQLGTKLADRLVSGDPAIALAREGGTTTVLFAGPGNAVTPVFAFKLGDTPRMLKEPVALKMVLGGNLTQSGSDLRAALRAGKAYADAWTKYETDLADYEKKKAEYEEAKKKLPPEKKPEASKPASTSPASTTPAATQPASTAPASTAPAATKPAATTLSDAAKAALPPEPKAPSKPNQSDALDPYRHILAGKMPFFVEAQRVDALKLAVTICRDEYPVKLVLLGAADAHRVLDLLKAKNVTVVVGPTLVRQVERETINLPQLLANRDIQFGFQSAATTGARQLPTAAKYAVRQGLGSEDALCAFTSCPAGFLHLDAVGKLESGRDADLVVFSGPPFAPGSRVLAVMIDGEWVYEEGTRE